MKSRTTSYDLNTIAHFRGKLLTQRVDLMARMQRNGHPIYVEELKGAERKDRPQLVEKHESEKRKDEQDLRDIESALQKCEDGTYGICQVCGKLILFARLEAMPTASRCVSCHAKHKVLQNKSSTESGQSNPLRIFTEKTGRRAAI